MSLIKNLDALEQPLDFSPFARYCKCMSDIDSILYLKNGKVFLIEIKKDTLNHNFEQILKSNQWQLYKELANNRPNYYLVYATHNQPIDLRVAINAIDCKVQYIETEGKALPTKDFEDLLACIHYYASIKDENETYYIIVRYEDKSLRYAIRKPIQKLWVLDKYVSISCDFQSKDEAIKYIATRYKAKFNINNKYLLFRKKDDKLIKEFSSLDF